MSLQEIKRILKEVIKEPLRDRSLFIKPLERSLNKEGFGLYWDDSNERYCIYLLEEADKERNQ
jgi:hypothetical protein